MRINELTFLCILFMLLISCEENDVQYDHVVYSGLGISDLKTVVMPKRASLLDLGARCYDFADHRPSMVNHLVLRFNKMQSCGSESFVAKNFFEKVPEQLNDVTLDTLLLDHNRLTLLPVWVFGKKLKHLDISFNSLSDNLTVGMANDECMLESVNISGNKFNRLPDEIMSCNSLKAVIVDPRQDRLEGIRGLRGKGVKVCVMSCD